MLEDGHYRTVQEYFVAHCFCCIYLSPLETAMLEDGHYRTVQEYFVSRVQKNLHIALAMDPTHAQVREYTTLQCNS